MVEVDDSTVYETINDIEEVDDFDNLPPVSEMAIEEIIGVDIGTFLALKEQIETEKKRHKQIRMAIREKQINIRKNEIFNEQLNILSILKNENKKLEEELNGFIEIEEIIGDKEYVKK